MNIEVKCYATLSDAHACNYRQSTGLRLNQGDTVKAVISKLRIPAKDIKLLFVNGRRAEPHTRLTEGDAIGIFPPVGGM